MEKNDITLSLQETLSGLIKAMSGTAELNITKGVICGTPLAAVSLEGMVSAEQLGELVLRPLSELSAAGLDAKIHVLDHITENMLLTADRQKVFSFDTAAEFLFSGFAVLFAQGRCYGCALGLQGFEKRPVSSAEAEPTLMCSQESFTETVRVNMALVRRRLKSKKLKMELLKAGERSDTDVCLMYMTDRAPGDIIVRIKRELSELELDTLLTVGALQPFIDDSYQSSVFTAVAVSERPDLICSRLNEGRVCVLIDGVPFAMILPSLFAENFSTMDDYSSKPFYSAFIRWVRYLSFFLSVAFPGFYVALADFHPEVFTLKLLLNLSVAEEATPYPLVAEVIMLMIFFEIMREAGLRLPKSVGSAVSIVGGLIIGDAAVKSGIVSAPLLIVVGITATASFVTPPIEQPVAVLRLIFIIAGGCAGLYGLAVCFTVLTANICAMNDFSVSYMSPAAPLDASALKDMIYRKTYREYEKAHTKLSDIREGDNE
jgi:spore germination protein KA